MHPGAPPQGRCPFALSRHARPRRTTWGLPSGCAADAPVLQRSGPERSVMPLVLAAWTCS
eukprot:1197638-Alexandrium_andersonii.AAC.1